MIKNDNCTSRLGWSIQEQSLLKTMKEEAGINSWKIISNELNSRFEKKCRSPKQCRERYTNYLREGVAEGSHRHWSEEEDYSLFCKYFIHGSKWVQIAKEILGRSQNSLKNRFYGALRKIIRKIDKAKKFSKCIDKKPLRQDMLLRVLDNFVSQNSSQYKQGDQFSIKCSRKNGVLMENIIKLGTRNQSNIQTGIIIQIGSQIKNLYLETRNRSSRAIKNEKKVDLDKQIMKIKALEHGQQTQISSKKVQQPALFSSKCIEHLPESPINFNQKLYLLQDDQQTVMKNSIYKQNDLLRQWHSILQQPLSENMQEQGM